MPAKYAASWKRGSCTSTAASMLVSALRQMAVRYITSGVASGSSTGRRTDVPGCARGARTFASCEQSSASARYSRSGWVRADVDTQRTSSGTRSTNLARSRTNAAFQSVMRPLASGSTASAIASTRFASMSVGTRATRPAARDWLSRQSSCSSFSRSESSRLVSNSRRALESAAMCFDRDSRSKAARASSRQS